ncbi:ATP-binding protein [Amorphoplanes digitatis]|uniref:DNA-binding CsgD family transcriptional regulator n=1 Tax=Actinoplanes digitatis TaxID=1868 RepID=A0A7W7HVM6_9ACTN|nr:LuxR family transcriptional regulator [Actinoplanes digitatis]MBB4761642.1 DNA-binding CsgD family transcriptional regulator [Actinoplanes digitatis]
MKGSSRWGALRHRTPALVGRDDELRSAEQMLAAARAGRGGTMFVTGDGGIGKSRLAAAAADMAFAADMSLLRGRGSAVGLTMPFRSLTEALLSLVRSGDPIDVTELGPYRHALGRLIPDWADGPAGPGPGSLVVLAEAVLRLTALAGRDRGCLIVLDDMQDADAETVAVVEYLIDNLGQQSTMLLCTVRDGPCAALDLARAAEQRGLAAVQTLLPLGPGDIRALAASCLDCPPADVPGPLVDSLVADSAGNPLLAEELLAAIVNSGQLVHESGCWTLPDVIRTSVPEALARAVAGRVEQLGPEARDLLSVGAVLGRRFPLALLHAVSGLDDRALLNHLHGEDAGRLVAPDEQTPDWYAFQHPLLGEAVLQLLAPGHRVVLARRAADAIAATYPGLPDEWCQVSASLRLQAQEPGAAARHYLEAGRRALAQGAASSAVDLLDRTRELLDGDPDQLAHATAIEALVSALAEAGLMERALDLANRLDVAPDGPDRRRRAELHTRLAWAANLAGRTADGLSQVALARAALGPDAPDEATAPIDVVEAHVMLDLPGPERFTVIETMTRRAAAVAEAVPLPEVACQAWQLLGALSRRRDLAEATACLERARAIAVRHHLPIWEIHALVRLGQDEALRNGGIALLEQTRQAALRCGAVTAGYHADTNIALHTVLHGDFAAAGPLIDRTLGATTRLKMIETTQLLLLSRAILGAHQGRRREMNDAIAEFRRWDGDQDLHAPRVHGLARAFCALLEEDRERAAAELARARRPGDANVSAHLSGEHGLGPLLRVLAGPGDDDPAPGARAGPAAALRWNRQFALLAQAILAGRAGRADDATAAFGEALLAAAPYATARHLCLRLGGEAALRDGWGDPVAWLRAAEEHFHAVGVVPVSSACRALLRQAGAVVNQRRTGAEDLPRELRAAGVTVREYEVLRLLVERLGNREIAGRLHLSPRTVEKHVASLIAKTGQANRIVLGEFAGEFVS